MKHMPFVIVLLALAVFLLLQTGCGHTAQGVGRLMQGIGQDVESWGEPQRNAHEQYRVPRDRVDRTSSY